MSKTAKDFQTLFLPRSIPFENVCKKEHLKKIWLYIPRRLYIPTRTYAKTLYFTDFYLKDIATYF
jgi:hypothetical protein